MANPIIGTTAELKTWARGKLEDADATQLTRVLTTATGWLSRRLGRSFFRESGIPIFFDGDRADGKVGEIVTIPLRYSPVGFGTLAIEEDGTVLTVGQGFDLTVDVIAQDADMDDRRCKLLRRPQQPLHALADVATHFAHWATGRQNIKVTIASGWDATKATGVANAPPDELMQVAYEVAWLMYSEPKRMGKTAQSRGQANTSFSSELSKFSQETIELWTAK